MQLLTEAINQNWQAEKIQSWVEKNTKEFFTFHPETKLKLLRSLNQKQIWQAFELLLELPQFMAVDLDKRLVLMLQSFPHLRSWERNGLWEVSFRRRIKEHTHVSMVAPEIELVIPG